MSRPSFTKTFHHTSYPAISPTRNELSCKDKTVIVTGGGQGIGAAAAESYAKAGATKIALIGRTKSKLIGQKDKLEAAYPGLTVFPATVDVGDTEGVGRAAHEIRAALGAWDIFVHNAGISGQLTRLVASDIDDWWSVFEINTKSIANFAKHFMTKCRLPGATYIYVNSGAAHLPVEYLPSCSAYSASKAAAARLVDWIAHEHPQLRTFSVHPGIVLTPMVGQSSQQVEYDDVELAADFFVWCASSEADFLRGRFLWASWDVEEMIQKKEELEINPELLRISLGGWPFAQGA